MTLEMNSQRVVCLLDVGGSDVRREERSLRQLGWHVISGFTEKIELWRDALALLNIDPRLPTSAEQIMSSTAMTGIASKAQECLKEAISNLQGPYVLDDICLTELLPIWPNIFKALNFEVYYVLVLRDPVLAVERLMDMYSLSQIQAESAYLIRVGGMSCELKHENLTFSRDVISSHPVRESLRSKNGSPSACASSELLSDSDIPQYPLSSTKIMSPLLIELAETFTQSGGDDIGLLRSKLETIGYALQCFAWVGRTNVVEAAVGFPRLGTTIDSIAAGIVDVQTRLDELQAAMSDSEDTHQWRATAQRALAASEAASSIATMALSGLMRQPTDSGVHDKHDLSPKRNSLWSAQSIHRIWRNVVRS